ncbi:hypothetical protein [Microtetraspora fusca]|uniref:hypothetical protein n=1 Tax=Microtetraspora fusca TaxID=1997 RepID=UPI001FE20963|nr:hypothetical protein [Microtetraspora fusca]
MKRTTPASAPAPPAYAPERPEERKTAVTRERARGKAGRKPILRAAVRGAIGAMAMSGFRQAMVALSAIERVPPESMLRRVVPSLFHRVPSRRRPALVEFAHWAYGAAGGAAFGLLPRAVRERPWAGPLYGVLIWGAFEGGLAPVVGLTEEKSHDPVERLVFLVDHLLYGVVVAASPWPHHDIPVAEDDRRGR